MRKSEFQKNNLYTVQKRLLAIVFAVTFLFALLAGRLVYIQVIWGRDLQLRALDQWTRDLPVSAPRGKILDRNGIVLAENETVYNLYVRAKTVEDPHHLASVVSKLFGIDEDVVYEKATNRKISESTLIKNVSKEQLDALYECDVKGIYYSISNKRVYPYGDLLSQVLGYVSSDGSGQTGIESYYNNYLRGTDGKLLSQADLIGLEIDGSTPYYLAPIDGLDVTLTVDQRIQAVTENVLKTAMIANRPKTASAIVMNPKTGEVLAMANLPGIDLNAVPRDNVELLMQNTRNYLVVDIYEPGSTFKVLTAAANLEEYRKGNKNAYSAQHIFSNGSGFRIVDGQKIKCWKKHEGSKHFNQTLTDALCNSCNPIFVDLALALGKDTFYEYLSKFGYGKVSNLDFPGESSGLLLPKSNVKSCDLARIGFGQTIAVTPLQLINATAAAVNGGKLMRPTLLKTVNDREGRRVFENYPTVLERPISEETSKQVAEMLEAVVSTGSGSHAKIDGVRVGGKTGTAQKYVNGVVSSDKYVSSFVGFFPVEDPKYICLVTVNEPLGQYYGSTVAAPLCKMIFEGILQIDQKQS